MKRHWNSIKCPFFENDSNIFITCERKWKTFFESKEEKVKYQHHFCNSIQNCQTCQKYKQINAKYNPSK